MYKMYAFLGEINVKICDLNGIENIISHKDFYDNKKQQEVYCIVVDRINVDFSLEHIKNCTFADAHAVLRCRKKLARQSESSFMIPKNKYNIFCKSDFFMQTNIINDHEILEKLHHEDSVFLVEHIISEFCRSISEIKENTWWMYVAEHESSGVKIVVGLGQGIVVSRILPASANVINGIQQTIQYVRRYGFDCHMKIISFIDIAIDDLDVTVVDAEKIANEIGWKNQSDIEFLLMKFTSKNKKIIQAFSKNKSLTNFVDMHWKKIIALSSTCALLFLIMLLMMVMKISNGKTQLKIIKDSYPILAEDRSKTFRAKISENNFTYIKEITDLLRADKNPLPFFFRVSALLRNNKVMPHKVVMSEPNAVQISCTINKNQLKNFEKFSDSDIDIIATKTDLSNTEYSEVYEPNDKNFSVKLCIKTK